MKQTVFKNKNDTHCESIIKKRSPAKFIHISTDGRIFKKISTVLPFKHRAVKHIFFFFHKLPAQQKKRTSLGKKNLASSTFRRTLQFFFFFLISEIQIKQPYTTYSANGTAEPWERREPSCRYRFEYRSLFANRSAT